MQLDVNKVKIVVAVPAESLEYVRMAMCNAGAGIIGNYTFCSMTTKCVGTFKPNDKANPYVWEKNKLEYVNEEKLEVLCDIADVKNILKELRKVHPYEEPAIDIIPLIDEENLIA